MDEERRKEKPKHVQEPRCAERGMRAPDSMHGSKNVTLLLSIPARGA